MAKDSIDEALEFLSKKEGIDIETSDKAETEVPGFISSGNLAINYVLSGRYLTGGFPLNRLTVLNGSEASGKTLLAMLACISCIRKGGRSFFFDTEGTYDSGLYEKLGGDPKKLYYKQYHTLEQVWTAMIKTIEAIRNKDKETPLLFIVDSLADTPSQIEFDSLDESHKGDGLDSGNIRTSAMWRASVNAKYLAMLSKFVATNNVTVIITNQLRDSMAKYGDSKAMPGGTHLKFAASSICRCSVHAKIYPVKGKTLDEEKKAGKKEKVAKEDDNADPIGIHGKLKNMKNKCFIPFKETEYNIIFGEGIDPLSGFGESLARYEKLKRRTISSKEWFIIKDGKEQVMELGTKEEMPGNFLKFFLENPKAFFDEEDWDEEEAKILLETLNASSFGGEIGEITPDVIVAE